MKIFGFFFFLSLANVSFGQKVTFPTEWEMLSRKKDGYKIFSPCEGQNPRIKITKDSLFHTLVLEGVNYKITKFEKVSNLKFKIFIDYPSSYEKKKDTIQIEYIDSKKRMAKWNWSYKMMMTPKAMKKYFPIIKHKCGNEKPLDEWAEFLELDF